MSEDFRAAPAQRWHDLDAVRAFALLLGVALHATMSFLTPQVWLIKDATHDALLGPLFYVIHMFRMTTFFGLAGFFGRLVLQKKGVGGFVGNRLKRIALPLVVFWPIVFAAIIAVAIAAYAPAAGRGTAATPPPALSAATFPLTHLWFLYVLLLFYAGAVVVKLITDVLHVGGVLGRVLDRIVAGLVRSDLVSIVLAAPVAVVFYLNAKWLMWFGIMSPDTGLMPSTMALAGFITAFVFGWWLHRSPDLVDHLAKRWLPYGVSAVALTWACLALAGTEPSITPVAGHDHPLYIAAYTLGSWAWTLGFIGAARVFLQGENKVLRYLADASYWIYIIHIPVLMGLQCALKDIPGPALAKYCGLVFGTVMFGLFTYGLMVRYTFIGTILNGRKRRAKAAAKQAGEALA